MTQPVIVQPGQAATSVSQQGKPVWVDVFPGQDLDTFTIGADRTPGQCYLRKAGNYQRWQVLQGNALSGATLVPMGEDCNDVEFEMYFWTWDQVQAWFTFCAKWFRAATVTGGVSSVSSLALAIGYPLLAAPPVSITKVVYVSCTAIEADDEDGYTSVVTFKKWRKPIAAPARPLATIPKAKTAQPTAEDLNQQTIAQQGAQIQGAADQLFGGPPQ